MTALPASSEVLYVYWLDKRGKPVSLSYPEFKKIAEAFKGTLEIRQHKHSFMALITE